MIKTWEDRLKKSTKIITSHDIRFAMQDEIDELRAKLAEYECEDDFECPNCGEVNPSTSCGLPNCGLLQGEAP